MNSCVWLILPNAMFPDMCKCTSQIANGSSDDIKGVARNYYVPILTRHQFALRRLLLPLPIVSFEPIVEQPPSSPLPSPSGPPDVAWMNAMAQFNLFVQVMRRHGNSVIGYGRSLRYYVTTTLDPPLDPARALTHVQQETEYVLAGGPFTQQTLSLANTERSDHLFNLLNALISLSQSAFNPDLTLPNTPNPQQQGLVATLKTTPPLQQQRKFLSDMLGQHDAAITLTNDEVRGDATRALPHMVPFCSPVDRLGSHPVPSSNHSGSHVTPAPQIANGANKDVQRVAQEVYLPVLTAHRTALAAALGSSPLQGGEGHIQGTPVAEAQP